MVIVYDFQPLPSRIFALQSALVWGKWAECRGDANEVINAPNND